MRAIRYLFFAVLAATIFNIIGCGSPDINAAARLGKTEKIKKALDQGSDVNKRGENGNTPLHFAAWEGHVDCVRVLLDHHANVNAVNNDGPHTPLHIAATFGRAEIVRLLLEAGANVNPRDSNGLTPLHFAAAKGHAEVAALLLKNGADLNARSKNRQETPLETARRIGNENVVRVLESTSR